MLLHFGTTLYLKKTVLQYPNYSFQNRDLHGYEDYRNTVVSAWGWGPQEYRGNGDKSCCNPGEWEHSPCCLVIEVLWIFIYTPHVCVKQCSIFILR